MSSARPLILVSNDDGIEAEGLWHLARAMQAHGDVVVAAPAFQQSGAGAAFTIYQELQSERAHSRLEGVEAWRISGTPSDAVTIALHRHVPRHVDLIVSGVNPGPNLGNDVIHSGTVGAAIQGHHRGLPSLAVSLASTDEAYLPAAATVGARIAGELLTSGEALFLNVNVPAHPQAELAETRITTIANTSAERLIEEEGPGGVIRRRLEYRNVDQISEGTDIWAVQQGHVSVSPLTTNLTAFDLIDMTARIVSA